MQHSFWKIQDSNLLREFFRNGRIRSLIYFFGVKVRMTKFYFSETDNRFQRRQSLATTASTSKLKMFRRAASTESDQIQRDLITKDEIGTSELKSKSKTGIGFMTAKKHLKSLLARKNEGINDAENEITLIQRKKESTITVMGEGHNFKLSRLHKSDTCAICGKIVSSIFVQGYKCTG